MDTNHKQLITMIGDLQDAVEQANMMISSMLPNISPRRTGYAQEFMKENLKLVESADELITEIDFKESQVDLFKQSGGGSFVSIKEMCDKFKGKS